MGVFEDTFNQFQARQNRTRGGAFLRGLGQGATLNFSDEIYAGIKAGGFSGPKYEEELRKVRESFKNYQEQFPGASMAGEITGVVGTSILPGSLAVRGGQALNTGSKLLNTAKNVGIGSAVGGGEAVIAGVGDSENKADYLPSGEALKDLGFGMAFGAGGYVVTSALAKPLSLFKDYVTRVAGKKASRVVENNLQKIAEDTGMTMDEVIGRIANGEIIAEMNATTRAVTRALRTKGSGTITQQLIEDVAKKRAKSGRMKSSERLRQGLAPGSKKDIYEEFTTANKKAQEEASGAYKNVAGIHRSADPEIETIVKEIILRQPELGAEVLKVSRALGQKPFFTIDKGGKYIFNRAPTINEAETIYRTMRGETSALFDAKKGERAGIMRDQYDNLKQSLDALYPDLASARNMSFLEKSTMEAFRNGQQVWGKSPNEARSLIREINNTFTNEDELSRVLSAFRKGAMENITGRAGRVSRKSMFKNLADEENNMNQILEEIFPEDQLKIVKNQLDQTVNSQALQDAVVGGSQTADILSGVNRLDKGGMLMDGIRATQLDPQAIINVARRISSEAMAGLNEKQQFELAQYLLETNPDNIERVLTQKGGIAELEKAIEVLAQRIKMTGAATSGVLSQNVME